MRHFVGNSIAGVVRLNCRIAWRCLANSPRQAPLRLWIWIGETDRRTSRKIDWL